MTELERLLTGCLRITPNRDVIVDETAFGIIADLLEEQNVMGGRHADAVRQAIRFKPFLPRRLPTDDACQWIIRDTVSRSRWVGFSYLREERRMIGFRLANGHDTEGIFLRHGTYHLQREAHEDAQFLAPLLKWHAIRFYLRYSETALIALLAHGGIPANIIEDAAEAHAPAA